MKLRTIIRAIIKENQQLADKVYFKTGLLDGDVKELILSVTNGDNYTKLIADVYYYLRHTKEITDYFDLLGELSFVYNQIKKYNKNVFPIKDFTNPLNVGNIGELIRTLNFRVRVVESIKKLPSIALRNLKNDIRTPRDSSEMSKFHNDIEYLLPIIEYIDKLDAEKRTKIYEKGFKSGNNLEDFIDFFQDNKNFITGNETTIQNVLELISDDSDLQLLYNKNNILVIRVDSVEGMQNIGCNSFWCFASKDFEYAYSSWIDNSPNDFVYVIMNFNESQDSSEFMTTIIDAISFNPEHAKHMKNQQSAFDMVNEPIEDIFNYFENTIGLETAKKLFTFEY
jgi:hypothetical protein